MAPPAVWQKAVSQDWPDDSRPRLSSAPRLSLQGWLRGGVASEWSPPPAGAAAASREWRGTAGRAWSCLHGNCRVPATRCPQISVAPSPERALRTIPQSPHPSHPSQGSVSVEWDPRSLVARDGAPSRGRNRSSRGWAPLAGPGVLQLGAGHQGEGTVVASSCCRHCGPEPSGDLNSSPWLARGPGGSGLWLVAAGGRCVLLARDRTGCGILEPGLGSRATLSLLSSSSLSQTPEWRA